MCPEYLGVMNFWLLSIHTHNTYMLEEHKTSIKAKKTLPREVINDTIHSIASCIPHLLLPLLRLRPRPISWSSILSTWWASSIISISVTISNFNWILGRICWCRWTKIGCRIWWQRLIQFCFDVRRIGSIRCGRFWLIIVRFGRNFLLGTIFKFSNANNGCKL